MRGYKTPETLVRSLALADEFFQGAGKRLDHIGKTRLRRARAARSAEDLRCQLAQVHLDVREAIGCLENLSVMLDRTIQVSEILEKQNG